MENPPVSATRSLGIALGAGAARGLSHIGLLKKLDSYGVRFPIVSGTSIGAIIGAAYACGRLAEAEEIARSVTPASMAEWADVDFEGSLFKGNAVEGIFRRLTGDMSFEDLRERGVFLTVVACDLNTGEAVFLSQGSIACATRASMSLPGIFQPVSMGSRLLVDGGLVDLVPTDAARAMGASRIVAVDVYHPKDIWMRAADGLRLSVAGAKELRVRLGEMVTNGQGHLVRSLSAYDEMVKDVPKLAGLTQSRSRKPYQSKTRERWTILTSLFRAMDVMNSSLAFEDEAQLLGIEMSADVVIRPEVGRFHGHQFYKAQRLIEAGELAADKNAPEILGLLEA